MELSQTESKNLLTNMCETLDKHRNQVIEEVAREMNQNSNHVITFSAIVKIKIYDSTGNLIEREDTGVGIRTQDRTKFAHILMPYTSSSPL